MKSSFALLAIVLFFAAQALGQNCTAGQFAIRKGGQDYMVITSPTQVKTCGVDNLCDEVTAAQQTLSVTNGALSISNGNTVQLPFLQHFIHCAPSANAAKDEYVPLFEVLNSDPIGSQALSLQSPDRININQNGTYLITITPSAWTGTNDTPFYTLLMDNNGKRVLASLGYGMGVTGSTTRIARLTAGQYLRWLVADGNVVSTAAENESTGVTVVMLRPF